MVGNPFVFGRQDGERERGGVSAVCSATVSWSRYILAGKHEMEHCCNDTKRGETEALGEKAVPEPICAPQFQHILIWYWTSASAMTDLPLTASTVKGKVAPVHNMKVYRGVEVKVHSHYCSVLDECECLSSRPGRSQPGKEPDTHWIGGWVGPIADLNVFGKVIFYPCRGFELLIVQPIP